MNFEDRVGPQDEAAAALFAAARAYRPPARARRRALRALGLPVGIALLASSAAQGAVALLSVKGVVVLAVVAVAGAGAVGGAVHLGARAHRSPAKAPPELAPVRAPAPATTVVLALAEVPAGSDIRAPATTTTTTTTTTATTTTTTRSMITAAATVGFTSTARARATAPAVAARAAVATQERAPLPPPLVEERVSVLRAELKLIGEARENLRVGDARGALLALAEHARRFPAGAMVEEVDLLRMRALVAAGDGERARGLGREFLARRPHSPLAGAVRALFGLPNPRGQEGDRR